MTLNQFASSYNYQELVDDSKKYLDASTWIEDLPPEVKDLWLERLKWIGLVARLAASDFQQGGNHFQRFKQDWNNLVSRRTTNRQSECQELFERMDLLWFRRLPLPDWSTIKAWDNYLKAIEDYHKPGLVIETLTAYDQMLERLSGSLFQVLPFVNKRYWTEVRYLGAVDQVYNHIGELRSDASRGICSFPEELLSRYSLKREQLLDGSCINKPEYQDLMRYWLDVYLPKLKQRTHRLLVATELHPSWLVLLEWMSKRHRSIEFGSVRTGLSIYKTPLSHRSPILR